MNITESLLVGIEHAHRLPGAPRCCRFRPGLDFREMLGAAASGSVHPSDVALVGLGLPRVAAVLAKRADCPSGT